VGGPLGASGCRGLQPQASGAALFRATLSGRARRRGRGCALTADGDTNTARPPFLRAQAFDSLELTDEKINAITDKIPQRPVGLVEGTSYTAVILAAFAVGAIGGRGRLVGRFWFAGATACGGAGLSPLVSAGPPFTADLERRRPCASGPTPPPSLPHPDPEQAVPFARCNLTPLPPPVPGLLCVQPRGDGGAGAGAAAGLQRGTGEAQDGPAHYRAPGVRHHG
jgi:hypothetical protein